MEDKVYHFVVGEISEKERLDRFLHGNLPEMSRSYIKKLLDDGQVTYNGALAKANQRVKAGDDVCLACPAPKPVEILPEDIPLKVVYEDADMLVVDKPQGMVVHPAAGNYTGTLVNALLFYCGESLSGINGEKRPGILHRIDKDTSGLLLIAKNDTAHRGLAEQIKAHTLTRAYKALVHGNFKTDGGTINEPIGRHPVDRKKMTVTWQNAKPAVTHFRVLERYGRYSLVECRLETGRTHQIRVHMSRHGHPIVGDKTYGAKKEEFRLEGQLLHAYKVGFVHPVTGEYMEFESPLPPYFEKICKMLKNL